VRMAASRGLRKFGYITTGEEKMITTIILSMCLATSSLSLGARAEDERAYTEGPVNEVDYIQVELQPF
jgi:hypothetical protein